MIIHFATCVRKEALGFISKVYPNCTVEDSGAVAELLDFVEKDIVRIQDPFIHGNSPQVIPGTHWNEDARKGLVSICQRMNEQIMATDTRKGKKETGA